MNKTKYIGVDVHSSTCSLCVMNSEGVELDYKTIATNGRLLIDYLKSLGDNIVIAFEECDLSGWLFDIFHKHFRRVIVCHPAANAQVKGPKTDKLDAHRLANLLRGGYLKEVFHDGSQREKFRVLISHYGDTVGEIVRMKNRLQAVNRRAGLSTQKDFLDHAAFIKEHLSAQLKQSTQIQTDYQKRIQTIAKRFQETKYLISLPGIKYIQASRIIAQIVDPRRFKNKYKLFAYCGLVRHPRISNNRSYGTTYIWGNRTLKCVFMMAAHSAIKGDNALHTYYDLKRTQGLSEEDARNAVARKIATLTLSLWKNKKYFDGKKFLASLPTEE